MLLKRHGQQDILFNGKGIQQIVFLENKAQVFPAEFGQGVFGQGCNVYVFIIDMACGNAVDGGEHVQQRGFTGAGSAHDAYKLALLYIETDTVHSFGSGGCVAVIFFYVAYPDIVIHVC